MEEPVVDVLTFDKETIIYISAVILHSDVCLQRIIFFIRDCYTSEGLITLLKGSVVMREGQAVIVYFPWPDSHPQKSQYVWEAAGFP